MVSIYGLNLTPRSDGHNSVERSLAISILLVQVNQLLMEQNIEKWLRKSTKAIAVGTARIMSYENIQRKTTGETGSYLCKA